MIYWKFKSFLTILLFSCGLVFSQSKYGKFVELNTESGMFHNNVKCIFEDSKGYFWIGTSDGLMRYDANAFDLFRKGKTGENSLSNNFINVIDEDRTKYAFWIGTEIGGLNYFDPIADVYKSYPLNISIESQTPFVRIISLAVLSDTTVVVGTEFYGLFKFNTKSEQYTPIHYSYTGSNDIRKIKKHKDHYYCSEYGGIIELNSQGDVTHYYDFKNEVPEESWGTIHDFDFTSDGQIIFGMGSSIYSYGLTDNKFSQLKTFKESVNINAICVERDTFVWVGTENLGVFYYSLSEKKSLYHFSSEVNEDGIILNDFVSCIVKNRNQPIVWIGTKNGISVYNYKGLKFEITDFGKTAPQSLETTYLLAKDKKGTYWFFDWMNLYYRPKGEPKFRKFDLITGRKTYAYEFFEDDKGNNYFVTSKGLIKYNTQTHQQENLKLLGKAKNAIEVSSAVKDSINNVWLLTGRGLQKYNLETSDVKEFPLLNGEITISRACVKLNNDQTQVWFAFNKGELYSFDIKKETYQKYDLSKVIQNKSYPNIILDIAFDQFDKVWIASYGGGLLRFDPEKNTISDSLAISSLENYAYSILKDKNHMLWVGTNFGITKVDPATMTMVEYQKDDGTFCEEFNDNSCYQSSDGHFLLGGINGFVEFDPLNIEVNTYDAPVYISSFVKEDSLLRYNEEFYEDVVYLNEPDSLVIPGKKNSFALYVSVLEYSQSFYNKIKWRLNGYDNDWNYDYPGSPISYNNLPQGQYLLEVVGINKDGYESKNVAKLQIIIHAPFVRTIYFKLLIFFVVMLLVFGFFRLRILLYQRHERILTQTVNKKTLELTQANKQLANSKDEISKQKSELEKNKYHLETLVRERTEDLRLAKEKAEQSDRLKTSFLANLSHEIRTPMNAIIGFSSLLKSTEYSNEEREEFVNIINQSSESLLILIDDMIDISRIESGNLSIIKSTFSITELVEETLDELYFEEISEFVEFKSSNLLNNHQDTIFTDKFRVKQIISNLLRNAFKFTQKGFVSLVIDACHKEDLVQKGFHITQEPDFEAVLFEIEDTGIGISEHELSVIFEPFQKAAGNDTKLYQGMGLGLSIVKRILQLLNGDVMVKSAKGQGTKFTIYIQR